MKEIYNTFQIGVAAFGGWFGYMLGGWDSLLYILVAFVVIDYATGVMCAIIEKKLSSEVGFRGIFKKIMIFLLVAIATMIDTKLVGDGAMFRTAVSFFYISNEGVSIVENATRLGLPVPEKLKDILEQIKNGDDDLNDKK